MNDAIRVLHFADVHIGMENYGRMDPETGLSSRVRDFLRRMDEMIDHARDHDVDLTIFAGDAFKNRTPNPTYVREFAHRVRDLAELSPVVLLEGNHDIPSQQMKASSVDIFDTLDVPNVIVGRGYDVHEVITKRGPVLVAAAPYPIRARLLEDVDTRGKSMAELDDLLQGTIADAIYDLMEEVHESDAPRILAGHFSVFGADYGSERQVMLGRDVAVLLDLLADPVWDYVALGHIHKHQNLTEGRTGAPPVIYPGSLERIDFGEEADPKGFIWAEVARGAAAWEFHEVKARRFVTLREDVRAAADPTRRLLAALDRDDLHDAVVRLIVQMTPETEALLQETEVLRALRGASYSAAMHKEIERPERMRLGTSPEGLTPIELLEHYFAAKEIPPARTAKLLEMAQALFQEEETP